MIRYWYSASFESVWAHEVFWSYSLELLPCKYTVIIYPQQGPLQRHSVQWDICLPDTTVTFTPSCCLFMVVHMVRKKLREEVTSCLLQRQSGRWSCSVVTPFKECYLSLCSKGPQRDNFVVLDKTHIRTAGHRCLCLSLTGSSSQSRWPVWVSPGPWAQFLRCTKSQRLETNATHVTAERRRHPGWQTVGTLLPAGRSALAFYGAPADQKAWKRYLEVKWTMNNLDTGKTWKARLEDGVKSEKTKLRGIKRRNRSCVHIFVFSCLNVCRKYLQMEIKYHFSD